LLAIYIVSVVDFKCLNLWMQFFFNRCYKILKTPLNIMLTFILFNIVVDT